MSKRHLRLWYWGTSKDLFTRQEIRSLDGVDGDRPSTGRRRKNTRRWCRGVVGREHTLVIDLPEYRRWSWNRCGPAPRWFKAAWSCVHVERCTACGRITREGWRLDEAECPDFAPEALSRR